jgi:hypothetical protein
MNLNSPSLFPVKPSLLSACMGANNPNVPAPMNTPRAKAPKVKVNSKDRLIDIFFFSSKFDMLIQ